MAQYVIGDVQGCWQTLNKLLQTIHYQPQQDTLYFTGDLVNRGPQSLAVLNFAVEHDVKTVLGNHDLHLLAVFHQQQAQSHKDTFADVLAADNCQILCDWLRQQPLLLQVDDYYLSHAGIYPLWSIHDALQYAAEYQSALQGQDYLAVLAQQYGDEPTGWQDSLTNYARLRFIVNAFTRMRLCNQTGELLLSYKGTVEDAPSSWHPWFAHPARQTVAQPLLFGHWAALGGQTNTKNVFALDTGCVWQGQLTALCLDNLQTTQVPFQD